MVFPIAGSLPGLGLVEAPLFKIMKNLILHICLAFSSVAFGEPSEKDQEDGLTYFIQDIRDSQEGECYLACYYSLTVHPHGILAKEGMFELTVKATIVDIIKGRLKRGDQLEFVRYSGTEVEAKKAASDFQGSLKFLFRDNDDKGKLGIDPQNPESVAAFSPERETVLLRFFKGDKK